MEEDEVMEEGVTGRKFGIILGGFRTEVEVLAELHLRYPWIQLTRRINGTGSAILITKDDRTTTLLSNLKTINGKDCSFRPLGNQARRAYIMMGVPSCVTVELLLQGQGGPRGLRHDKMEHRKTTSGTPTSMGQDSTGGEETPRKVYQRIRELPNKAICEQTATMLQLPEVWPPGQDLQVRGPDLQILRGTTRFGPVQGQGVSHTKVRKLWAGACHDQSPLPKETGSREQGEDVAHTSTNNATSQQEPGPHPTEKRMVLTDRTRSGTTALYSEESINSTRHQYRGTNGSKYNQTIKTNSKEIYTKAEQEAGTSKGGIRTTTNYQCMDESLRPITSGVSVGYVSEPDKTTHFQDHRQTRNTSQSARYKHNLNKKREEQMDDVRETIQMTLTGAASLLKKISTGNTRLVPALKKIMEAAMDAINTLTA